MSDEDEPADGAVHRYRSLCFECGGAGKMTRPVLSIIGGQPGTVYAVQRCRYCAGDGRLDGLHPPV